MSYEEQLSTSSLKFVKFVEKEAVSSIAALKSFLKRGNGKGDADLPDIQ